MWTNYADVADRWIGGAIPADETQVVTLLEDAEDSVRQAYPDIQTRIDNDELPVERVVKVVSRMVIRHLRNPTGTRSTQQGAGPYQTTVTFGGNEPGALYLTNEDHRELAPNRVGKGKAFSTDLTPSTHSTQPDPWVHVWSEV